MPICTQKTRIISCQVDLRPGLESAFADWQARLNSTITLLPGFVSVEFLAPSNERKGWWVAQRFKDEESAKAWQDTPKYQALMEELKNLAVEGGVEEIDAEESSLQGITEVIVTEVQPDKEEAYRGWTAKIHHAEAKFPGFRGVYLQPPSNPKSKHWITLLQFDTKENLERWLESKERQQILDESSSMVSSLESHRIISPYAGWFASLAKAGELPPVWKQTMIILLVLFPIIMLEFKFLNPLLVDLNKALGTFIGNAISVTLISFPGMPIAIRFLKWWLTPQGKNKQAITFWGTLVVLVLYLIEIFIFWNFI